MSQTNEGQEHDLEFTGERYMPEISGQIAFEHLHRYHLAGRLVAGASVLDVACGEGYGSKILARTAKEVVGVDIDADTVLHARLKYSGENVRFVEASAAMLPFAEGIFDAVVSFETIEHHDQHEEMMSEVKRVLKPGGILVLSSPNKLHYTIETGEKNPYHVKELLREELLELVGRYFQRVILFGQRVVHGSLIVRETGDSAFSTFSQGRQLDKSVGLRRPVYDLVVASDGAVPDLGSSFFEMETHGMDPARFYGAYLPERIAEADAKIVRLDDEANGLKGAIAALELAKKQSSDDAAQAHAALASRDSEYRRLQADHAQMESDLFDAKSALANAEIVAERQREAEQQLRQALDESNGALALDRDRLAQTQARLDATLNSFTWRSTAWLRRLFGSEKR